VGKVKHKLTKQWDMIKVEGNAIKRLKKTCPRCGPGAYMAEHKDRYFCGSCHMTEWKKKE
jgi:small subunit ribosomal protein S27Ae